MKKNFMMRAASVLLVAVMLTTCAISGTFAKYVTSADVNDSARVAKWGVEVTTVGHLFSDSYKDNETTWTADETGATIRVQAKTEDENVVAPGTRNDTGMTFTLTGTPEVDTHVEIDVNVTEDVFLLTNDGLANMTTGSKTDYFDNTADYYPVVFTLKNNAGKTLVEGNLTAIKTFLEDLTGDYETNKDLSTLWTSTIDPSIKTDGVYHLTWAWDFRDGTADEQDTLLGNLAANKTVVNAEQAALYAADSVNCPKETLVDGTDYNLDINVEIIISVTQLD